MAYVNLKNISHFNFKIILKLIAAIFNTMIKTLFIISVFFALISCGGRNKSTTNVSTETLSVFRDQLSAGNFSQAQYNLNHNKFYTKKNNKILQNLEMGKLYHLQHKYDSSNIFLNLADNLMEDKHNIFTYTGNDIDRVLIHYYKTLNYLYLNNPDEALVEAKRINIQINEINDKRYSAYEKKIDPFAQILQGIIYEKMGNYNDALLSYKDAVALYDKFGTSGYLGVNMPNQLIADVINTAQKAGSIAERDYYCEKFNVSYNDVKDTSKNQVIFFWENGMSPMKKHERFELKLIKTNVANMFMVSDYAQLQIPIAISIGEAKELASSNISKININYATSIDPVSVYDNLSVSNSAINAQPILIENIVQRMHISPLTYSELEEDVTNLIRNELKRRRDEKANAKKIAEDNLQKKYKSVDEARKKAEAELANLKSEDDRAKKIKEMDDAKKRADSDIASLKNQIANPTISSNYSSLDYTRNSNLGENRSWQSLPATIAYTKIPIAMGQNKLIINLGSTNGQTKIDTILINSRNKLNIINYTSMDHLPFNYDAFVPIVN